MKLMVYSVFDVKAAVFANPFFMGNDAVAVRGFTGAVNSPESMLYKHPEDYSLYRLGTFDDSVGRMEPEAQPVVLCTAASVKQLRKLGRVDELEVERKTDIASKTLEKVAEGVYAPKEN